LQIQILKENDPIADAVTPSTISDIPKADPTSTKLSINISADLMAIIKDIIKITGISKVSMGFT